MQDDRFARALRCFFAMVSIGIALMAICLFVFIHFVNYFFR